MRGSMLWSGGDWGNITGSVINGYEIMISI